MAIVVSSFPSFGTLIKSLALVTGVDNLTVMGELIHKC